MMMSNGGENFQNSQVFSKKGFSMATGFVLVL